SRATEKDLRGFLGGFGFQCDMALAPVGPFSGGEKARLALALLIFQKPNLLLLDEPTNHLDLDMRYALAHALQDYEGALVLVSHDRYLLRSVADEFWLVSGGAVESFDGDLDDYRRKLADSRRAAVSPSDPQNSALSRKDQRRQQAEKRSQLGPLRKALSQAEARLDTLSRSRQTLEEQLADPVLYESGEKDRLMALVAKKADVDRDVAAAELAWLEASEALEMAEREMAA
ncbi:MAG: ATP-binding cassette protein, partial [Proteobacteria bacterium]|nr:ATP-binding cassette protein [Pseudomonadota bacterium]